MEEILPKLKKVFSKWESGSKPEKILPIAKMAEGTSVYIIDRPGSDQSNILAGHLSPPRKDLDQVAASTMNSIFGGKFTSRMNMNLRETKGWAYWTRSLIRDTVGQRPYLFVAPVQTDKTAESIHEVKEELREILKDKPIAQAELEVAKTEQTHKLPGSFETMGDVLDGIEDIVRHHLPDNYFDTYAERVNGLDLNDVREMAKRLLKPEQLTWVIVGDREKIQESIEKLHLGKIQILDTDGKLVTK